MIARQKTSRQLSDTGIILVGPKFPENIGASARIASNFGIAQLIIVTDEEFDQERMLKMATHKAAHLIREMRICATTAEAAEPFHFLVGTTARQGRHRPQPDLALRVYRQQVRVPRRGLVRAHLLATNGAQHHRRRVHWVHRRQA